MKYTGMVDVWQQAVRKEVSATATAITFNGNPVIAVFIHSVEGNHSLSEASRAALMYSKK